MTRPTTWIALLLVLGTWPLAWTDTALRGLWPPLVALAVIAATRHALAGLLAGAFCGAVILGGGDPWQAYLALLRDHLAPSLGSAWKTGAILFTLVLGGFAAVLDAGGGFRTVLGRLTAGRGDADRRFQLAAAGLGLLCFFDGLANSMMVGRVGRDLADRCGVARVKLAYIVDSTSSAVACVALVSTWIAFQLTMIREGFALAGREVNPYAEFLSSLPSNFHCWFTLVLLFVSIGRRFDPGPMGGFAAVARARGPLPPAGRRAAGACGVRPGAVGGAAGGVLRRLLPAGHRRCAAAGDPRQDRGGLRRRRRPAGDGAGRSGGHPGRGVCCFRRPDRGARPWPGPPSSTARAPCSARS